MLFQEAANLATFTEEILNGKLHFLCHVEECLQQECLGVHSKENGYGWLREGKGVCLLTQQLTSTENCWKVHAKVKSITR